MNEFFIGNKFYLTPGVGEPIVITLLDNNKVSSNNLNITAWSVEKPKDSKISIRLFIEAQLYARCIFDELGAWKGRDRDNKWVTLISQDSQFNKKTRELLHSAVAIDPKLHWSEKLKRIIWPTTIDWKAQQYRLPLVSRDTQPTNRTAVALLASNRPEYLTQVVTALAPQLQGVYPVFAFLDFVDTLSQSHCANIIRSAFPHAEIIRRDFNWGCGRNLIDAREQLFTNLGYDRVFMFEDDGVPSSNYVQVMENLLDWAEQNYDNVGVVQGWNHCLHQKHEKATKLNTVEPVLCNLWGYLMSSKVWQNIRSQMLYFQDNFLVGNYSERPAHLVREWLHEQFAKRLKFPQLQGRHYPIDLRYNYDRLEYVKKIPGGQDGTTDVLCMCEGYTRIATQVNHLKYIGAQGIHMTPTRFQFQGYASIKLDEFDSVKDIKEFKVGTRWPVKSETGLIYARN